MISNKFPGSPSPAKSRPSLPTSPAHFQAMRLATQQIHMNTNSTGNPNLANSNSAIFTNLQMNFDYNQNAANGLELAGFCSPSGTY